MPGNAGLSSAGSRGILPLAGESSQGVGPELFESAQTDTLPHPPEGVKVVEKVVDRHEGGGRHLAREMKVAQIGAGGGPAGGGGGLPVGGPGGASESGGAGPEAAGAG